jgi:hypothetical protein
MPMSTLYLFERDHRKGGLTHKIDPAIDGEREYVNDDTLSAAGGGFPSHGRILVLALESGRSSTK